MIPLELAHKNDFIKIEVNTEFNLIKLTWLKQPSSSVFRQEILNFAALASRYNLSNLLLDVRERTLLPEADQNWLVEAILPLLKNQSIRLAYLINVDDFDIVDTYKIHDLILTDPKYSKQVAGMIFLDEEEAQNWLLEIGLYL